MALESFSPRFVEPPKVNLSIDGSRSDGWLSDATKVVPFPSMVWSSGRDLTTSPLTKEHKNDSMHVESDGSGPASKGTDEGDTGRPMQVLMNASEALGQSNEEQNEMSSGQKLSFRDMVLSKHRMEAIHFAVLSSDNGGEASNRNADTNLENYGLGDPIVEGVLIENNQSNSNDGVTSRDGMASVSHMNWLVASSGVVVPTLVSLNPSTHVVVKVKGAVRLGLMLNAKGCLNNMRTLTRKLVHLGKLIDRTLKDMLVEKSTSTSVDDVGMNVSMVFVEGVHQRESSPIGENAMLCYASVRVVFCLF
ncbi:hypothetical protein V6N12_065933 [Hibiscus sabdariffa]|uniref:Uncharacterized protein n=1 Tax=Hibiscus sabdariffa TaxID=183260 RepID=A0ABR2BF16_9ROSI